MTKSTTKNDQSGLIAIVSVIVGAGLLIAYLSYRGDDVGRLSSLVGGLGHWPYFGVTGLLYSFLGLVIALLIGVAWLGLGRTIIRLIAPLRKLIGPGWLGLTNAVAVGAAAWSAIWFLLGLVGGYHKPVAAAALVIGVGLAVWQRRGWVRRSDADNNDERSTPAAKMLFALILVPVVLALIASLAPPTAKDSLFYHLALPQAFLAQGSNAPIAGNIASFFTLGTEMHSVWAMLLGSFVNPRVAEAAAGATLFLFYPLILLSIYGWARELELNRIWSLLAVLLFAAVPSAYYVAANSYIDLALSLYVILAVYALGRWWKTLEPGWAVALAIFLGAALSSKLTALFVFAAVALMVLLRARSAKDDDPPRVGKILSAGVLALALGAVLASPVYLRNWATTGSPIFPFYMSIWKGTAPGWDVERSNLYQQINSHYGGEHKGAVDYVLTPVKISITAQPELVEFYDGVIGCAFLFGLPLVIWAWWKYDLPLELKPALGVCLVMFLFWMFSSELLRYLLPIFPVLAVAISASAQTIAENRRSLGRVWQVSLAVLAGAGLLTSVAWFLQLNPVQVVLGGEARDSYLARNIDYYPYYQLINTQTPADAKIWLINMRRDAFNLNRPYFSDFMFEDWTIKNLVWESKDTDELRAKIKQMGISYIMVRHDVLLNPDLSSIVDDKRSAVENQAKLTMLYQLFFDKANVVRSDKKFSLVKVQ
jgi:hypothetical protein